MMKLRSAAAGLVLAALSFAPAFGQGVGQLGAGQVLGNSTATQARAAPSSLTAMFDRGFCSTANASLARISGVWGCITYSSELSFTGSVLGVTANGITNAMLRQSAALSLIGRSANSTGNVADISATPGSSCVFVENASTLQCGTVATNGIANNAVTLAKLATQAANTVLANATSGAAVPTAFAMPSCSTSASALIWTTNTGFGCNSAISVAIANVTGLGTGVATALAVNTGSAGAFARIIASGTIALGTSLISANTCGAAATASATNALTTDVIDVGFNGDPTGVTGYTPSAMLTLVVYPTANTVNIKQCNLTSSSITPSALTLNWAVRR